ncbi:MAG: DUF721 domain-containing protein [Planctomycetota bacterium]|nr:DUF721 domain-containing protein [Planctomycetota bacterium]
MTGDLTPDEQRFEDLRKRQRFTPLTPRIDNILSRLLTKTGYARVKSANVLDEAWGEVAGPLASVTKVGNIRRGVLDVICKNSAVMQELTFQKQRVIQQLNQRLDEQKIKNVKLRVVDF